MAQKKYTRNHSKTLPNPDTTAPLLYFLHCSILNINNIIYLLFTGSDVHHHDQ